MPIPLEVDELDKLIIRLQRAIKEKQLKQVSLVEKLNAVEVSKGVCERYADAASRALMEEKNKNLISMEEYRRAKQLLHKNEDLVFGYMIEFNKLQSQQTSIKNELPILEAELSKAIEKRNMWGCVVGFEP